MLTPKLLLKELIKFLSTLLHNIFAAIVVGVIGVPFLIFWATGTLDVLFQTIKSPTPLWATIALGLLLVVYIYLKTLPNNSSKTSSDKVFLMEDNDLKWKVTVRSNQTFFIDDHPYCKYHDSRYALVDGKQYMCRERFDGSCKSRIVKIEGVESLRALANIKAEKNVYKYKTKC